MDGVLRMDSRNGSDILLVTSDELLTSELKRLVDGFPTEENWRLARCTSMHQLPDLLENPPLALLLDERALLWTDGRPAIAETMPCILLNRSAHPAMPWPIDAADVLDVDRLDSFRLYRTLIHLREKKNLQQALVQQTVRSTLLKEGAADGLWEWDYVADRVELSPRCHEILGFAHSSTLSSPDWFDFVYPEDLPKVTSALQRHLESNATAWECQFRVRHRTGGCRWVHCRGVSHRDPAGQVIRLAGSWTDITKQKLIEEQLLHDAYHDALTGLPNRVILIDLLQRALARTWRNSAYRFALMILDLDRFKVVNDSAGPEAGDQLLVAAARRLRTCLRPADTIVRLGGDEFAILVEDFRSLADLTAICDRIHEEFQLPFRTSSDELFTSASIGVALSGPGHHSPEDVLRDADTAMNWAKNNGRARTEVFNEMMRNNAVSLMRMETQLRLAVARNDFRLHYQPIVCLKTGDIVAFEALIRWHHPEFGEVPPSDFIPLAEENGLIVAIGKWVLHEACRQTRDWQAKFGNRRLSISVNLSSRQFSQPDLLEQIDYICADTGIAKRTLRLEITESVMMENAVAAGGILNELRRRDIELHVDDFGTGYSSLATLPTYPVDTLKMDRSFVDRMGTDGTNTEIVRTIVALGANLRMQVTAEGIETAEQLAILRRLRCGHGQGYYFSRAVEPSIAEQMLAAPPCWVA